MLFVPAKGITEIGTTHRDVVGGGTQCADADAVGCFGCSGIAPGGAFVAR